MKRIGLLIGFLALLIVVLPTVTAQDEKKKKDDAKAEAKKDEPKNDDEKKTGEKKKPEPKKVEKTKLNYSASFRTKIISINPDNNSEFTIEVQEIDPVKVQQVNVWMVQQQASLTQQLFNAQRQKGVGYLQAMANYNNAVANFQYQKAQKNIYSPKNLDVKAAENAKVRTSFLPQEFDDAGFPKKWTRKEIEARRDKTGLPGFPAEFDAIKSGQYIDIYMAKVAPTKPAPKKKKRGPDDDDVPAVQKRPEYVMIVVIGAPMK